MHKRTNPVVRKDRLLDDVADLNAPNAIRIGSRRWYTWLANGTGFRFEGGSGQFTARCEKRRGRRYWYAYRRVRGKLYKAYLGRSEELSRERLDQTSAHLAGQIWLPQLSEPSDAVDWVTALDHPPATANVTEDWPAPDHSFLSLIKIRPPALPHVLIGRRRLTERIKTPITLLVAPSGFGKSTLLNEWRQTGSMPVAWVSLDPDDNQLLRFWSTLMAALGTVLPNVGQPMPSRLHSPSASDLSEIVVEISNAIIRGCDAPDAPPRFGLVLDDYHHIHHKAIHASLQIWLEHLPPAMQLIISSHMQPPLVWGHLRARGLVTEFGTEDLRFTLEEGIGYLSQHRRGQPLAFSEMQKIMKRTEGWPAGLALATLALDQARGRDQPITTFSGAHSYLREYFLGSVLDHQPPHVQQFLLETAILKHLTGPLCDAVTGRTDGSDMLSYLWRENLFLVRMEEPNWYRYHDLFAETLCSQLERQLAAEIPRLHRRAAEWYRSQNAPDDAVYHLLAIEAWDEAAALIEEIVLHELEQSGDYSRLMRWLRQLPEAVIRQHPTLLRVYVKLAALDLSQLEVRQILERVETNISHKPIANSAADEQSVLAEIQRIRRFWMTGDAEWPARSTDGKHDAVWQMLDGIVSYARQIRRNDEKAETVARELYEMAQARSHLYVLLIAGGGYAHYALLRGHLRRSERIAREVLQLAVAKRGKLPESASMALTVLSQVCYERNQLPQAHQLLLRAAEVDPNPTSSNMPIMEALQRAKVEFAQGDGTAAMATIEAARELHAKYPAGLFRDRDLVAYQAWFAVRQGDSAGAERLLSEIGTNRPHAFLSLVRAELLLKQEQPAVAADILQQLLQQFPNGLYLEPNLGARVLLALALFEQRLVNQARQIMTEAVRLAAPENLIRPFLDCSIQSLSLLTLVLHTSSLTTQSQSFVKQVLRLDGNPDGPKKILLKSELTALSTAASITAREQQVLRLLVGGLSNREIAAQLSFSEATVKTHLKNIYRKLGVSSRTRAIAEARALRLC
jgi:LuxR family maltose regulon positive regulatory protein